MGCVVSLICSIGGFGCLGADGLAHWVLVVGSHSTVSTLLFEDGSTDLFVHVRVMVDVQVVHPCFS